MAKIHVRTDKLVQNKKNKFFNDPEHTNKPEEYAEEMLFPKEKYVGKLYEQIKNIMLDIFANINITPLKNYVGFKKANSMYNILSVWPKENSLEIVLNAKRGNIQDPEELTYDISNRRWSAAQYALRFDENTNIEYVKNLIRQTYNCVK